MGLPEVSPSRPPRVRVPLSGAGGCRKPPYVMVRLCGKRILPMRMGKCFPQTPLRKTPGLRQTRQLVGHRPSPGPGLLHRGWGRASRARCPPPVNLPEDRPPKGLLERRGEAIPALPALPASAVLEPFLACGYCAGIAGIGGEEAGEYPQSGLPSWTGFTAFAGIAAIVSPLFLKARGPEWQVSPTPARGREALRAPLDTQGGPERRRACP